MKKTSLVIMAAGIGSRYGSGIKQLERVGPSGELVIDYSIHDALKAGFDEIIFIIRTEIEDEFKEIIGERISKLVPVKYVYQELSDLPKGFEAPSGRTKPWGTAQAVWAAREVIDSPFVVINADDFYGASPYGALHDFLVNKMSEDPAVYDYCMAGYILENTLSKNGTVTRGICKEDSAHRLLSVTETPDIAWQGQNLVGGDKEKVILDPKSLVSMNMWGFSPNIIPVLEENFISFLNGLRDGDIKSEYLIPVLMGELIQKGLVSISVLPVHEKWYGLTYKEDKQYVSEAILKMVKDSIYGEKLFD